MIKTTCSWGEGEDILVVLEDHPVLLYENPTDFDRSKYGCIKNGSLFLTAEEAKKLAQELLLLVDVVDELNQKYFEASKKKPPEEGE